MYDNPAAGVETFLFCLELFSVSLSSLCLVEHSLEPLDLLLKPEKLDWILLLRPPPLAPPVGLLHTSTYLLVFCSCPPEPGILHVVSSRPETKNTVQQDKSPSA